MDWHFRHRDVLCGAHQRHDRAAGRVTRLETLRTSTASVRKHAELAGQQRHARTGAQATGFYCGIVSNRPQQSREIILRGYELDVLHSCVWRAVRHRPSSGLAHACRAGSLSFHQSELLVFLCLYRYARRAPTRRNWWPCLYESKIVQNKRYGANHGNAGALRVLALHGWTLDLSIHSADGADVIFSEEL